MATRAPTENQYRRLRILASGAAGLSWGRRDTEPMLRRGWVTAERSDSYYQWVRITADGLRALALAVEKFGLPELGPKLETRKRVCADCGSDRYNIVDIEVPGPEVSDE